MKTTFSALALAGALALTAIGTLPASAQSSADILDHPAAITYSWGVIIAHDDDPARSYTFRELDAARGAQSRGAPSASAILDDPRTVKYSWGVIVSSDDGPTQSYTLQELNAARAN